MQGARDYNNLIKKGERLGLVEQINSNIYRHNNLVFLLGEHARGKTFQMYAVDGNNFDNSCVKYASVGCEKLEVYGILGGQNGWTEFYGWKEEGKWQDTFEQLCIQIEDEIDKALKKSEELRLRKEELQRVELQEKKNKFESLF